MQRSAVHLLCLMLSAASARGDNWPAWRGPRGQGISSEQHLPLTWSQTLNIRWKTPLPAPGNSTPVIWNDHVFITQSLDQGKRRALLAFSRRDGRKLWQHEAACEVTETTHPQNPACSASAVTDGQAVYADFASAGVVAYDFSGKKLWHRDLGPVLHKWGNGSSPVLYKDLLIVFHGPGEPAFLAALDKRTGDPVWKKAETAINSPVFGTWCTPVVVHAGGRDELIMALPGDRIGGEGEFKAYEPLTGRELWRCRGLGNEVYAMPAVAATADLVVGISGHNGPLLAVRPGGNGDVTASRRMWRIAGKNPQRIGSGVISDGRLYLADAPGLVECLDTRSGETIWKERVAGDVWGSMLLADGRLYVPTLQGTTFVLAAGPKFQLLAKNDVKEPIYSALAASQGELFLRTYAHLYCIGDGK
jgi:outer membrane protein assembly factor BamB